MKLRGRYSLLNMSSTMQQLDLRARQALFWPAQYQQWRMNPMRLDARPQAQYIGFFNLIWLVANDVIVGIALAKFLRDHADELARALFALANRVLGHTVEEMLLWLHAWPGGIKLNAELNFFLGQLFFWMLGLWYITMKAVEPWLPTVVWWIGTSGFFGVSFSLALFSDVYTLIVVHINVFYLVAAKIYYWQRAALVSLFNLFRGKRYNILRRRVDNANYGLDQLLLGTIMFTLLAFLFPTTLVYYVCFLGFRVVSTVVHASIEALLAFVNHFPLFAIMLRFKDHRRLPGGIAIEYGMVGHDAVVKRDGTLSSPPSSPSLPLLEIHNKPISFGNIFYQYRHLLGRFQRHYFSRNTLRALIRGETFGRLSRVNYPTIPRS
ncbi:hypothetical protein CXG81DRAFT_14555 [Caulochytrium protostelioides]|uniref:Gpi1-domain-containing protein n=1 Tax=Caulochytrium protostelioides TaxID=1555241 RepID=A0A4P9X329_9FUNG|nr:hypothetical protein CXG81DRAFT_14555 [Caulochytrium protostelioides]|eukprot:RKO99415.1 hypothetical protein CXG81DRAFT_14555 [Caulochytrium protostelioides]